MSLNDKAAEVAEDYKEALQDLTLNSRFEISNLTVVARENTEHALAIAETLMEHIKQVGTPSHLAQSILSVVGQQKHSLCLHIRHHTPYTPRVIQLTARSGSTATKTSLVIRP
jgi:pre-mRNA cleavage complex 2 protein Pcf11